MFGQRSYWIWIHKLCLPRRSLSRFYLLGSLLFIFRNSETHSEHRHIIIQQQNITTSTVEP